MRSPSAQVEMNPKFYPMKQMQFLTGNPKQIGILRLDFISPLLFVNCQTSSQMQQSCYALDYEQI